MDHVIKKDTDFETLRNIVNVLFDCCININIEESEEFSTVSLPQAVTTSLQLIRLIQDNTQCVQNQSALLLQNDLLCHLFTISTQYPYISLHILISNDMLRLIMEDEKHQSLSIKIIKIVKKAVQTNKKAVKTAPSKSIEVLMDELVYKLTSSSDELIVKHSIELLLLIANQHKPYKITMKKRYRGLKAVLKRWEGLGMDRSILNLSNILEPATLKNIHDVDLDEKRKAVETIWAYYQGWRTRRSLFALRRVVLKLQRQFRWKQREIREKEIEKRLEKLQDQMHVSAKCQLSRFANERKMKIIEDTPADQLFYHLEKERNLAALCIQSSWKSYKAKKLYLQQKENLVKDKAARVLQQNVRKYLMKKFQQDNNKKKLKSQETFSRIFPKITKDERNQFEVDIMQWQAIHKRFGVSNEDVIETHQQAQQQIASYYRLRYNEENEDSHLDAIITRIHHQQDLLQHMPTLSEAKAEDIYRLSSFSTAVQLAAEIEHSKQMRLLGLPWWKKLRDCEEETIDIEPC